MTIILRKISVFRINVLIQIVLLGLCFAMVSKAHSKTTIHSVSPSIAIKYYKNHAARAFEAFNEERKNNFSSEIDMLFLKIDREASYSETKANQSGYYEFTLLTKAVIQFVDDLRNEDQWSLVGIQNRDLRKHLQQSFVGISLAIKKSNFINLQINSDQHNKLHDILVSQSTSLFYASYRERQRADFFWTSFFLHQLKYPMDLSALHLQYTAKWPIYSSQIARLALSAATEINRTSRNDVDFLYQTALTKTVHELGIRELQKNYLKQLLRLGDSEKVKEVKRLMANQLFVSTAKNVYHNPLTIFSFIQFVIGYVFVAWPLEFILIALSLFVFVFQANGVLSDDEKNRARNPIRKVWMMFTKAYMGSQVPFFSKLAASLILFGIGLYFNSARNFVESLIANV
jgi:hypothetical protein